MYPTQSMHASRGLKTTSRLCRPEEFWRDLPSSEPNGKVGKQSGKFHATCWQLVGGVRALAMSLPAGNSKLVAPRGSMPMNLWVRLTTAARGRGAAIAQTYLLTDFTDLHPAVSMRPSGSW
jgi:hypothetical protein